MNDLPGLNESFFSCSSSSSSFLSADSIQNSADGNGANYPTLQDNLNAVFSDYPRNFNIAHINAQSVAGHFSDIQHTFNCNHLDAVLISESFLKPSLPSSLFGLSDFVLICNDRIGAGCGGVAIYLRKTIPYKILRASPPTYSASAEFIFLELIMHSSKIPLCFLFT